MCSYGDSDLLFVHTRSLNLSKLQRISIYLLTFVCEKRKSKARFFKMFISFLIFVTVCSNNEFYYRVKYLSI